MYRNFSDESFKNGLERMKPVTLREDYASLNLFWSDATESQTKTYTAAVTKMDSTYKANRILSHNTCVDITCYI